MFRKRSLPWNWHAQSRLELRAFASVHCVGLELKRWRVHIIIEIRCSVFIIDIIDGTAVIKNSFRVEYGVSRFPIRTGLIMLFVITSGRVNQQRSVLSKCQRNSTCVVFYRSKFICTCLSASKPRTEFGRRIRCMFSGKWSATGVNLWNIRTSLSI